MAIVAYPRISNLDEFQPLFRLPGVRVQWARTPAQLRGAHWLILPGSKHTSGDLAWLRQQGLDLAIRAHAAAGGAVLGVCGGLQMLGAELVDPHGVDGAARGLGLLPLRTTFEATKTVCHREARFGPLAGPWAALSGVAVAGYEIHHGATALQRRTRAAKPVLDPSLGWQNRRGNVLGVYLHGLFEDARVTSALFGAKAPALDGVFDAMADFVEEHFRRGVLDRLIGRSPQRAVARARLSV